MRTENRTTGITPLLMSIVLAAIAGCGADSGPSNPKHEGPLTAEDVNRMSFEELASLPAEKLFLLPAEEVLKLSPKDIEKWSKAGARASVREQDAKDRVADSVSSDAEMQQSAANNSRSTTSAATNPNAHKLERDALTLLKHPQFGMGALCDKIYDEKLSDVTHGTLTDQYGTKTRFPGMVGHVEYMCVNALTGDREKNTMFWVILGYDDVAERFRCMKFAGQPVIKNLKKQCNFVPNDV